MRKGAKTPPSMGEVLGEFLRRTGINRKIQEQKILNSWEEAVGEGVAERTQAIRVQNRVLQVKVANSVWWGRSPSRNESSHLSRLFCDSHHTPQ